MLVNSQKFKITYEQPWILIPLLIVGILGTFLISLNIVRYVVILFGLISVAVTINNPRFGLRLLFIFATSVYFTKRIEFYIYRNDSSEFNNPVSIIPEFLILILLITVFLKRDGLSLKFYRTPLSLSVTALIGWSFLQIFNPLSSVVVGLYGFRLTSYYIILFFIGQRLFHYKEEIYGFVKFSIFLTLLISFYGIWQYAINFPTWDKTWFLHFFNSESYSWLAGSRFTWEELRKFSTMKTPASAALFYAIQLVLIISLYLWQRRNKYLIAMIPVAAALFLTYVRGGWISSIVSLLVVSILWNSRRFTQSTKKIVIIALFLALIGTSLLYVGINTVTANLPIQNSGIAKRLQSLTDPFQASEFLWRTEIWIDSIKIVVSNPLGYGIGSTGGAAQRFESGFGVVDSLYFKLLLELGWVGFFLFCLIIGYSIRGAWRIYIKTEDKYYRFFVINSLGIIALIVVNGIVGPVLEYDASMIYFWFWLGLLDNLTRHPIPSKPISYCQ